jgi:carboxymethylenebutenolidase
MNKTMRNLIGILMIASFVFFAGCTGKETTTPEQTPVSTPSQIPVSTPTGHEQAGEPNMSYLGLADVFKGKSAVNVSTSNIDVDIDGVRVSGFLVQPVTPGKYPGIIMIHEWWGLNDQVKSMADITAREGYVVFAVDLFKGNVATTMGGAQANLQNNPNNETIPKMQTAVKYLRTMTNVDKSKIASLGWCYGGGQSFQLGVNDDLQATVIYYGQVSTDKAILMKMKQPVLGLFGVEDTSIPVKDVREFERILKEQGTRVNISIYEGAGHAFSNPTNTQAFRKEQAMDAWNKTLGFLELNLKGT